MQQNQSLSEEGVSLYPALIRVRTEEERSKEALAGMAAGAAVGAVVGELPGALVGGIVGFVLGFFRTPAEQVNK